MKLVLILAIFLFHSCKRHNEIPIQISRLEQSLFSLHVDSIRDAVPHLKQQYGSLLDMLSFELNIAAPDNPEYPEELASFITYPDMVFTYEKVMEFFPDINDIEKGLGRAFYNYGKEFPDRDIPSVYTLISGFNSKWFVGDDIVAIALDGYLGRDEDIYFMLQLPNYERHLRERKYIVPDCMNVWISTEFPLDLSTNDVLSNIIYHGKIMYALHRLLPSTPDSLIFGFTPAQMRWCRNNTAQMWTFLVENKLLFETDQFTINKLVAPAPFTSTFTRESPGRAVYWLGYSIVASYMRREKVTLEELFLNDDYQQILAKARFRP